MASFSELEKRLLLCILIGDEDLSLVVSYQYTTVCTSRRIDCHHSSRAYYVHIHRLSKGEHGVQKIVWDESLRVGVPELDQQHQELINIINFFAEEPGAEYTSERINTVIGMVVEYSINHFKTEESHMESIGYPQLAEHMKEHKELLVKFGHATTLVRQKKRGAYDLFELLRSWLDNHVRQSDMQYAHYLVAMKEEVNE